MVRKNNILMMLRCLHTRHGELKTNEFGDEMNRRLIECKLDVSENQMRAISVEKLGL